MSEVNFSRFVSVFITTYGRTLKGQPAQADAPKTNISEGFRTQMQGAARNMINNDINSTRLELAQFNNFDKSSLVKDLLNLPKDLTSLLSMLGAKSYTGLLNLENLDMSKLIKLLDGSGKTALDKLMRMTIEFNKMGIHDTSAFKELQALINACVPAAGTLSNSALKNLMLLYLPWLPLNEQINQDDEIGGIDQSKNEKSDSLTVFITTLNYGNIKILITKDSQTSIHVFITTKEGFPKQELIREANISQFNVKHEIEFEEKELQLKGDEELTEPKVSLISGKSNDVNPFLVLVAKTLIKSVIDIDKKASLNKERKKLLD